MSVLGRYKQQSIENLKRLLDLDDWLEDSEEVSDVDVVISPTTDPPLAVNTVIDDSGKKFAYFVSGGVDGETYTVQFRSTTQLQLRADEIEIEIEDTLNG